MIWSELQRELQNCSGIDCSATQLEVDKALAGASQGAADGGVSSDALGAVLSWMQERRGEAFVIATANDVSSLPPELLRKGRFDEVWWIDLPNRGERIEVLGAALRQHNRDHLNAVGSQVDHNKVADACQGFTGSEIAALVPDALFAAFADGEREICTDDLLTAAKSVIPLSETKKEQIEAMRTWAKGRARPATTPQIQQSTSGRRLLDL